ncbi:hypothetical protein SEVIR_1G175000v4 [Setaria viridis]|uniref:DNA-directed RNA polymerase III subunit RPC4 n=1 Tax=Setaria viridis TaxID=4556 RepID=A0A4U6WBZ9_SETVI|nr:uncharacterized protein LOC117852157 [Setaria viridis]TKW39374.1 hypothetical protein SEVIR_1G175000v2 [Setaria viridis]
MEKEDTKKKEADDSTPQRRRKAGLKFAPKVLPKKDPKIIPKTEPQEENKALTIDKKLMSGLGSLQSSYGPGSGTKAEKQGTPVQVAFGRADPSIARTFPTRRSFSSDVSAVKLPKEHDEPWDYNCTDYPVTLPLRRPNSGNAEILDEEEFGHSSGRAQVSELSAAEELGLMQRVDTPQLLFFQFPTTLPLPRQADPEAGTNMNMNAKSMGDNRKRRLDSIHGCGLKELPDGFMGKMLVYKSGKVKMTLGDVLFDVSAGSNCMFPQEVVAINTREKHCCGIGEIGKRAIVTPDINSLLESIEI